MKGCKTCPAFVKCETTYRGSGCAALRYTYGLDNDPEIVTNADWIRSMSDEELAEFIGHYSLCDRIQGEINWCEERAVCEDCLPEWLRQPAEEAPNV